MDLDLWRKITIYDEGVTRTHEPEEGKGSKIFEFLSRMDNYFSIRSLEIFGSGMNDIYLMFRH